MRLTGILELLRRQARYREILNSLQQQNLETPTLGVLEAARPYLLAALQQDWPGPIVVLSSTPESARQLADQVRVWSETPEQVLYFPAPDGLFYDRTTWDRDTISMRAATLARLSSVQAQEAPDAGRGLVVTASTWSVLTKSVSPMAFRRAIRTIRVGDILPQYDLLTHLVKAGYDAVVTVEAPGTFSHRGSLIDIFPPNLPQPVRLDFFGDEIDSMRLFDPATQRSEQQEQEVLLAPATEALPEWGRQASDALGALELEPLQTAIRLRMQEDIEKLRNGQGFAGIEYYLPYLYPRPGTLFDFCRNALVLVDDRLGVESAALGLERQAISLHAEMIEKGQLPPNMAVPYLTLNELLLRLDAHHSVTLGHTTEDEDLPFDQELVAAPKFGGQLSMALSDIADYHREERRVVLITRQAERLSDLLREQNIYSTPTDEIVTPPETGSVTIVNGIAAEGWAFLPEHLIVLTDAELFGWTRPRKRAPTRRRATAPETFFADLKEGDYVVHVDHGIGRYHGLVRKTIGSLAREYLEIEYAAGDRLFVPIHQADRVSRYVGADDREPYIHRLGGNEWNLVRTRAERAARDIALELLELYAAREVTPGYSFSQDTPWQMELENSFPYEETDDQLRALTEVKADMERPRPMDRLICGDVGYGKTEVALRAAFKAVMDNKQVAVLVPTTVLAQQHFHTFRRRLRAFPVTVDMLSRFRSPQEQDQVIDGLRTGQVDIVIGTHRLLSRDVSFKDMGLLIIDEEQRFGVSHKEQLKQMRREVDVLTLTATPIPRTLYLALGGARDMSIIDTPPEDRLPVRTFVAGRDETLIRNAIQRERDRGGQVYFVHNRVEDIYAVADQVQQIVPEATLAVGHGQMPEDQLAQVMLGFSQGEYDVLVCTTIIESGLDIPNVNTIIIDRADTFGLAQLYQLRGRVGRGTNRAYAYLMYNDRAPLTDIARKRLQTIQEATELGAGFRVAMRDMEIRGAGEILGAEQHGHIAAIGFDLYVRLLQRAVEELQTSLGEPATAIRRAQEGVAATLRPYGIGPSIDLPLSAYLPEDFMPDRALRLRFYRRLARVDSETAVDELMQELRDRFGELPEPVVNLLALLRVRALADDAGVDAINTEDQQLAVALPDPLPSEAARELERQQPGLRARGTRIWIPLRENWQEALQAILRRLADRRAVAA